MAQRSFQVIDHFYLEPMAVRQKGLSLEYWEPDESIGWRTKVWQPRQVKRLIEKSFRIEIDYWGDDSTEVQSCNGVFFTAFATGSHSEAIKIHYDSPANWTSLLVYLTPDAPCDAGTSFWQHRETGLTAKPNRRDALRLGLTLEKLETIIDRDGWRRHRWIEIDRVGNVFNRALIFRAGTFHSATRHFGNNLENGRLYQSFHFPLARKLTSSRIRKP